MQFEESEDTVEAAPLRTHEDILLAHYVPTYVMLPVRNNPTSLCAQVQYIVRPVRNNPTPLFAHVRHASGEEHAQPLVFSFIDTLGECMECIEHACKVCNAMFACMCRASREEHDHPLATLHGRCGGLRPLERAGWTCCRAALQSVL